MSLPNIIHGSEEVSFKVRTATEGVGNTSVGSKMVVEDGRAYRWAHVGVGPTIVGHLWQGELWDVSDNGNQAVDTLASGVFVFTGVGVSNNSIAVNDLTDGFVWIDSAANLNPGWVIVSNTAITAGAATGTITIGTKTVDEVIAAEQISFAKNLWFDIIQSPAPLTAAPVGFAVSVIADEGFGWIQTSGMVRALTVGTILEGDLVVSSVTTAGAVQPTTNAFETLGPQVGITVGDLAGGEYSAIFATLDS